MTSSNVRSLMQTGLNDFLFADIGTEPNGTTLSVASVFGRQGSDPWAEADRLAKLSKPAAVESLARTIAAMPGNLWNLADANPIAARLVDLLPPASTNPLKQVNVMATGWRRPRTSTIIMLVIFSLGVAYAATTMLPDNKTTLVDDGGAASVAPIR